MVYISSLISQIILAILFTVTIINKFVLAKFVVVLWKKITTHNYHSKKSKLKIFCKVCYRLILKATSVRSVFCFIMAIIHTLLWFSYCIPKQYKYNLYWRHNFLTIHQILLHKKFSVHVWHIRELFGLPNIHGAPRFLNRPVLVLRRNKQKYEDDLHFTPVSLHEKDTNSQTKNNKLFSCWIS